MFSKILVNKQEKTMIYSMDDNSDLEDSKVYSIQFKYEMLSIYINPRRVAVAAFQEFLCFCCCPAAIYIYKPGDGGGKAYCAIAASCLPRRPSKGAGAPRGEQL